MLTLSNLDIQCQEYIGNIQFLNSSNQTVCNSQPLSIQCQVNNIERVNIQYTNNNGVSFINIESNLPVILREGKYYTNYNWEFNNFTSYGFAIKLKISSATNPNIFSITDNFIVYNHPVIENIIGGGHYCLGERIVLLCKAQGSLLTYQWKKDNNIISGETNSTLIFDSGQFYNTGVYSCGCKRS